MSTPKHTPGPWRIIDSRDQGKATIVGSDLHHSGEEMRMDEQAINDVYVMIRAAERLAVKLEGMPSMGGDAVTAHNLAEFIERKLIPIELRRP